MEDLYDQCNSSSSIQAGINTNTNSLNGVLSGSSSTSSTTSNSTFSANWGTTINSTNGMLYSNMNSYYSFGSSESAYVDFMCRILGIDMDFSKFINMDDSEKTAFIRNHIIGNILK